MRYLQEKKLNLKIHRSFLLFKLFNNNIQESFTPFVETKLYNNDMHIIYKCVLFSYLSYKDRTIIVFPPEIKLEFGKFDSNVSRIPFFIVTDPKINAIVIGLRGSSCMDDFITDSMGNGVSYNSGKFHERIFSTASYVFMTCKTKILELNKIYNKIHENEYEQSSTNETYQNSSEISVTDDDNEEESEFEEEEEDSEEKINEDLHSIHRSVSNENLHKIKEPNRNSINLRRTSSNENLNELDSMLSSHFFHRSFLSSNSNSDENENENKNCDSILTNTPLSKKRSSSFSINNNNLLKFCSFENSNDIQNSEGSSTNCKSKCKSKSRSKRSLQTTMMTQIHSKCQKEIKIHQI